MGQDIDDKEHVVVYGGHELSLAETRYSTTEREALAVLDGINCYQPYLTGRKFYAHTDHGSLSWLMKVKDPTGRLARWALRLQHFDFEIIHRPGAANGNADAISRRSYSLPPSALSVTLEPPSLAVIDDLSPSLQSLYKLQCQDKDLLETIQYLETSHLPLQDN